MSLPEGKWTEVLNVTFVGSGSPGYRITVTHGVSYRRYWNGIRMSSGNISHSDTFNNGGSGKMSIDLFPLHPNTTYTIAPAN